jgi:hypothetical protein
LSSFALSGCSSISMACVPFAFHQHRGDFSRKRPSAMACCARVSEAMAKHPVLRG